MAVGLLVLAFSSGLTDAPAATSAPLTACVNKKTGEMRLQPGQKSRKKCPKGSRKVVWNRQAPAAVREVRDAEGRLVGRFLSLVPESVESYLVARDGGNYSYNRLGELEPFSADLAFIDPACQGPAYYPSQAFPKAGLLQTVGTRGRIVWRTGEPGSYGPARAWRATGPITEASDQQIYGWSRSGNCFPSISFTGSLTLLEEIPAPADFAGPLTLKPRGTR